MRSPVLIAMVLLAAARMSASQDSRPSWESRLDGQNVRWESPSKDAAGSMPLGNGEVVLNVWVEAATGDVLILVARTDSVSEISRVLKLGRIRLTIERAPFRNAGDFVQEVHLRTGMITISGRSTRLAIFVDSDAGVVHVAGESPVARSITASVECWRNAPRKITGAEQRSAWAVHDAPFDLVESADVFEETGNAITWYHRNETTVVPRLLELQSLTGVVGTFDPIYRRTFGGCLEGEGFVRSDARTIHSRDPMTTFELRVATHTDVTESVDAWKRGLEREAARSRDSRAAVARTRAWWDAFWRRASVFVSSPATPEVGASITRGYMLQRFVQACQGRGAWPIKFNGGFYTVEPVALGQNFDPDYRNWGDCHWWQNVRHMYHPMLTSGDVEMMNPLFRLYEASRALANNRSAIYHGCAGAYFPETMTLFGTYSGGDYGWKREGLKPKDVQCPWWDDAWNQGPELVALMLDRWDFTRDTGFLRRRALPMAQDVLTWFDTRFRKDDRGRIVLDPTQVVETYWSGVVDDMPSVAGLIAVTRRLVALPESETTVEQRAFFRHMRDACPELPIQDVAVPAGTKRALAPASRYDKTESNCENGQLYAVWPFRLVSTLDPKWMPEAMTAYDTRKNHLDSGWGYDGNVAATLGMANEAARILKVKCANSHKAYRWPATWGPNYDWLPDQNHGGNLLNTTQLMLLQGESIEAGGRIALLPAWPKEWDVSFTLHAAANTTVTCEAAGGRIVRLDVSPPERAKDIVWPAGWERVK